MPNGILITTDDRMVIMGDVDYTALTTAIGGYIQLVPLAGKFEGLSLYVHEEGKLLGLPYNTIATTAWEVSYGATDIILGNAVLMNAQTDSEGNELPMTLTQMEQVLEELRKSLVALN